MHLKPFCSRAKMNYPQKCNLKNWKKSVKISRNITVDCALEPSLSQFKREDTATKKIMTT